MQDGAEDCQSSGGQLRLREASLKSSKTFALHGSQDPLFRCNLLKVSVSETGPGNEMASVARAAELAKSWSATSPKPPSGGGAGAMMPSFFSSRAAEDAAQG